MHSLPVRLHHILIFLSTTFALDSATKAWFEPEWSRPTITGCFCSGPGLVQLFCIFCLRAVSTMSKVQSEPKTTISKYQSSALKFIDESQRRNSSEIRREIRSHVRKESHDRQKRLNAAAKARSLEGRPRKLLQKQPDREKSSSPESLPNEHPPAPDVVDLDTFDISFVTNSGNHDSLVDELSLDLEAKMPTSGDMKATAFLERKCGPVTDLLGYSNATPYALLVGKDGPIFQVHDRNWSFAHQGPGTSPAVSVWMPCSAIPMPNIRNGRPGLLANSKVLSRIAGGPEYFGFKQDLIRWVNDRLCSQKATDEKTVGAIACLTSWELARGNISEISLHMDGLLRIVTLRGGLKEFRLIRQFCWKIHLIDLLVAVMTSSQPRFRDQNPQRPAPALVINTSIGKLQIADSPLYGDVPFDQLLEGSSFCTASVKLLQEMRDLTEGFRGVASVPADISGHGGPFDIINAASNIYRRAFMTPPVPFHSVWNENDVKKICDALEDTSNDDTWTYYPGILLWVLLTALSAAKYKRRSYIAFFVFRAGTTAIWWGMEEATTSVMTFLRVKLAAERKG
ncbi:hypothetical protein VTL71DRAFT_10237 [Oculimacula yallundae]|uniref:Uncharacterized protein n=1 Tax=Oculimacula yallundae TaxID=86028 RepID=A0ABR4CT18_9HELO